MWKTPSKFSMFFLVFAFCDVTVAAVCVVLTVVAATINVSYDKFAQEKD
jgi:hypothetical protein